jgi:radical SAM protein with 4Fe4S-binding SPASM domain
MLPATFERIVSEVAANVPPIRVAVLYHGGEPLLNKRFPLMARRIKETGIAFVKTVTNGMLIREDSADALVTCGLDAIEISLDGETPEENDRVRRRAKSERVLNAIRLLLEARKKSNSSVKLVVATTQFVKGEWSIDQPAPVPRWLRSAFGPSEDAIEFKGTWAMQWPSNQPSCGYDLLHDDRPRLQQPSCSLLQDTITIRWDGTVVACCYDLTTLSNLGNVNHKSLADIWSCDEFTAFRQQFYSGRFPSLCQNCGVVTGEKYLLRKVAGALPGQVTTSLSDLRKSM